MNFRELSYLCFAHPKWLGLSLLIYHSVLAIKSQVLYFTMFYYVLLYFTIFYYVLLYFTIFYYALLYFTMFYYILLYFTVFYYILLCFTIFYYVLLYFTMFCYILLYFTILWVFSNHNKQKQIHNVKRTGLTITIII